jgi:PAS domain-containing protein
MAERQPSPTEPSGKTVARENHEIKEKNQDEFGPVHPPVGLAEARSEQAIRASELSYRRLFETAQDGILILDVDTGRITDVNPFLFKLLGFSRSEMVGKTVGELSPFKDLECN